MLSSQVQYNTVRSTLPPPAAKCTLNTKAWKIKCRHNRIRKERALLTSPNRPPTARKTTTELLEERASYSHDPLFLDNIMGMAFSDFFFSIWAFANWSQFAYSKNFHYSGDVCPLLVR